MRVKTFSILVGSDACNARCPFCVSKMTPALGVELKEPAVNWRNFEIACRLAKQSGVTTAMFTGKGEPTLFPGQINKYLERIARYEFPLIELQTNGIAIADKLSDYDCHLHNWYAMGITTIAISIAHYEQKKNGAIYLPYRKKYIDLPMLIEVLHQHGFSVRLTCIAIRGFIDSKEELQRLIAFAKESRVEQLTITPVNRPDEGSHREIFDWVHANHLTTDQLQDIQHYLEVNGSRLMQLAHGAVIFDVNGQNVCLSNCLAIQPEAEEMRNLIFFPDGHLRYYWQYSGAILF